MSSDLKLIVDGEEVHMNKFVSGIFRDIILALLNNLRDIEIEEISKIEVS